jgi:hypothetical protein
MSITHLIRKNWWLIVTALVVLATAGIFAAVMLGNLNTEVTASAPDKPVVRVEKKAETPPPTPIAPQPTGPVSIDAAQFMAYSPVWNPPDQGEGYWQIVDPANGYPEDGGTDYVLAHSCDAGSCTGDQLKTLKVGDQLTYLGTPYLVQRTTDVAKTEIANQDIWVHDPNRLVLITCAIDTTSGGFDNNTIIIANRVS